MQVNQFSEGGEDFKAGIPNGEDSALEGSASNQPAHQNCWIEFGTGCEFDICRNGQKKRMSNGFRDTSTSSTTFEGYGCIQSNSQVLMSPNS